MLWKEQDHCFWVLVSQQGRKWAREGRVVSTGPVPSGRIHLLSAEWHVKPSHFTEEGHDPTQFRGISVWNSLTSCTNLAKTAQLPPSLKLWGQSPQEPWGVECRSLRLLLIIPPPLNSLQYQRSKLDNGAVKSAVSFAPRYQDSALLSSAFLTEGKGC